MGSAKPRGRQRGQCWDCEVSWQGTVVTRFRKVQRHLGKWRKDLDSVEPRGTFIRTETPPFLSDLRGGAVSANGCEQEGRDQCGAKDVKKNHPGARQQKKETKAWVQPAFSKMFLYCDSSCGNEI